MMTNLIPFEESEQAMSMLAEGKALSVQFVFDDNGPYKGYKKYYYDLLGFDFDDRINPSFYIATILSEIGNMPKHYVVVGGDGKVTAGLHGDLFYIDVDELEDLKDILWVIANTVGMGQ